MMMIMMQQGTMMIIRKSPDFAGIVTKHHEVFLHQASKHFLNHVLSLGIISDQGSGLMDT
jgi:hypothetical protein